MINITFKPETLELEIMGHSGRGEKGKDIVCAAISTLFYTLAQSVIDSQNMLTKKPIFRDKDGNGYLKCKPKKDYEGNIARSYWTILEGFEMVANKYKDFVSLNIVG